jgi:hypothetical protein
MSEKLYAEDVGHYWETSKSSPDTWIERAKKVIQANGGVDIGEAFGNRNGRAAYLLEFSIGSDQFRIAWPVLESRRGKERSCRVQAATMLYHDIKARCISSRVLGARAAFFAYYQLPDGRTAAEASTPTLMNTFPRLLGASNV